ncbi:hypothetical protein FKM82_019483 [Ascaphus truei]
MVRRCAKIGTWNGDVPRSGHGTEMCQDRDAGWRCAKIGTWDRGARFCSAYAHLHIHACENPFWSFDVY